MLTRSQQRTYDFIVTFIHDKGYSPTTTEIASGTGLASRGVVYRYLKALVAANKITLIPNRHRNIQLESSLLPAMPMPSVEIPLKGLIAAGHPIEAIEQQDTLSLSQVFSQENVFALKVRGDSMIDEGIMHGDMVICRMTSVAENGDIVVALIDQQEATLKRWQSLDDGNIKLFPANQTLSPMTYAAERITVQGVFIGLVRLP